MVGKLEKFKIPVTEMNRRDIFGGGRVSEPRYRISSVAAIESPRWIDVVGGGGKG
jgi:hypothetical protein